MATDGDHGVRDARVGEQLLRAFHTARGIITEQRQLGAGSRLARVSGYAFAGGYLFGAVRSIARREGARAVLRMATRIVSAELDARVHGSESVS